MAKEPRNFLPVQRGDFVFQIKVCGITRVVDAEWAIASGADAIGLNFYRESPRAIDLKRARRIAAVVARRVTIVGVFVNASLEELGAACDCLPLDYLQLHGDESPEDLQALDRRPVIRAFRSGKEGTAPVRSYLERCAQLGRSPCAALIDAGNSNLYGGTGQVVAWQLWKEWPKQLGGIPLVLAGGLKEENIQQAISVVAPAAVDTASGVEISPGRKDRGRMERFVREARVAFAEIP